MKTSGRGWTGALPLAWAAAASAGVGASFLARPPDLDPSAVPDDPRRRVTNPVPQVAPPSAPALPREKTAALREAFDQRASLRAYEGAPPVVPHSISDLDMRTCRTCHATGLRAGDKIARAVSHTYLTNCTQCHVEAVNQTFGAVDDPPNSFVPLRPQSAGGFRALSGSPPNIPHTTFMRTNCASCHGPHGYPGLQPDHLDRLNCVQCHAPSADLDQLSPFFNAAAREGLNGERPR